MPDSAAPDRLVGPALTVEHLQIAFPGIGLVVTIPHLTLPPGSAVAIEGPSGAGKTSLLHALAGLERPASGEVRWGEVALWSLPSPARDRWRRRALGLVFQDIHLIEGFSALDNVCLPLLFERLRVPAEARAHARALLDQLGVDATRPIAVMSRGERQRVALARALLPRPSLLLADEPTASLDRASAAEVAGLLLEAATATGATLIVASHDPVLLDRMPRRLALASGALTEMPA